MKSEIFEVRIPVDYSAKQSMLIGPTLVLAEAEQRNCAISRVWVSRHTDPELIAAVQAAVGKHISIDEVSQAELGQLAGGRSHGGIVAALGARRQRGRGRTEGGLWAMIGLSVPGFVRSASYFRSV